MIELLKKAAITIAKDKNLQKTIVNGIAALTAGHVMSHHPGDVATDAVDIFAQTSRGIEPQPDASAGIRNVAKELGSTLHSTILRDNTTITLSQKTVEMVSYGLSSGFKYLLSAPLSIMFNVGYNIPLAIYKGMCLKPITKTSMSMTKDIIFYVSQQNGELSIRTGEAFFTILKITLIKSGITIIIVIITFIIVRKCGNTIINMIKNNKKSGIDHFEPDNEVETY